MTTGEPNGVSRRVLTFVVRPRVTTRRLTPLGSPWLLWSVVFILFDHSSADAQQVFPSVTVQPDRILLSGSSQLTLAVEGPAPLRVEVPKELEQILSPSTAAAWQIRASAPPKITALDAGRERWQQTFRLSPFLPGDKQTIVFQPIKLFAGGQLNAQEVSFPSQEIRVQTTIAEARPDAARSVTGIEELPTVAPPPPDDVSWPFIALLGSIFVAVLIVGVIRRSRRKPPPIPPREWASRELDHLERERALGAITGLEFARRLSGIVREFLERRYAVPAARLTTPELLDALSAAEWPAERIELVRHVLERCDRTKFAGDSWDQTELEELILRSRELTAAVEPGTFAT